MKPLTRYALESYVQGRHERHEMTADPDGKWYAKDEADARIAELEREAERWKMDGVHSCHDGCQRIACVQRRRIAELERDLDAAIDAARSKE